MSGTPDVSLVDRLSTLPHLCDVPRQELEWLVQHGTLEVFEPGEVVARKGKPIDTLWVIVAGVLSVRVDRGVGPRLVIEWTTGELSGMLPYSRMTTPPGDNYVERRAELLTIHRDEFPEMIQRCPTVTAQAVHSMIDRARSFNASDLHDEKMVSLGRLAAGLAHELNNPAAATVRAAKLLPTGLGEGQAAAREIARAALDSRQLEAIDEMLAEVMSRADASESTLERADREEAIFEWLDARGASGACASSLADTTLGTEDLERLAKVVPESILGAAVQWISSHARTVSLAEEVERTAERISALVGAIKRFSHMDHLATPEAVAIEPGLRDTIRVLAAKATTKKVTISVDLPPELPPVRASGAELNQIWLNLVDNALDACPEGGRIDITGERRLQRVLVRVVDDGPGVAPEILPRIFDPFVTTKAPGQGTGLGLDIARRLARSFHGDLTVDTRPGRTEFKVSLVADPAVD